MPSFRPPATDHWPLSTTHPPPPPSGLDGGRRRCDSPNAMTIGTRIYTWWKGAPVGGDEAGNRYFREKSPPPGRRERRWVVYGGEAEASRVPPEWHAWLHYTTDRPPEPGGTPRRPWQKPHRPNATGTPDAYRPQGHLLMGGRRARARSEYRPWRPP